jgi:hypothetical protein
MNDQDSEWRSKGATLSHKTAQEEFGLTWEEIVRAIRAGKLQYREHSMYGNPWFRLLRREVEALVRDRHGANYLKDRQAKTELARINRELKRLKGQIAGLEERKAKLIAGSGKAVLDCRAPRTSEQRARHAHRGASLRPCNDAGTRARAPSPGPRSRNRSIRSIPD